MLVTLVSPALAGWATIETLFHPRKVYTGADGEYFLSQDDDKQSPLWRALGLESGNPGRRSSDRIVKTVGDWIVWGFFFAGIAAFLIGSVWGVILLVRKLLGWS